MTTAERLGGTAVGEYLKSHRGVRRAVLTGGVIAALLAVVLIALPVVAAMLAERWLQDHGAADAAIGDVDFNPFTGTLRVESLEAGGGPQSRFAVALAELDVRWWPLVSRRAHVERLRLEGVRLDVVVGDDGAVRIGAVHLPAGSAAEAPGAKIPPAEDAGATAAEAPPWGFGSDFVNLSDLDVTYRHGVLDTTVQVRTVRVGSHYSWLGEESAELVLDLSVDGAPLSLRSDVAPWSDQPTVSGELTLTDFDLAGLAPELEALAGLREIQGRVAMALTVSGRYGADGVLRLDVRGPVNVADAAFDMDGIVGAQRALRWDGTVSLALPASDDEALVTVDGAWQLLGTSATLPGELSGGSPVQVRLDDLRWSGRAEYSPADGDTSPLKLGLNAGLALDGLAVDREDLSMALLRLGGLRLEDVVVTAVDDVVLNTLALTDLRLLGPAPASEGAPVLAVTGLTAADVGWSGNRLAVGRLTIEAPVLALVREEDGALARVSALQAALSESAAAAADTDGVADVVVDEAAVAEAAEQTDAAPFQVSVDALTVTGAEWLSFEDRSVAPPARFQLDTLDLELTGLDSAGAEPMRVRLETSDPLRTRLLAEGTVGAFTAPMAVNMNVTLDDLELPPLSPYVPGYNIFRGRLSSQSAIALEGDALDVANDLTIDRLQLAGKGAEGDEGFLAQGMAMPVDVALDLLRDREDRIRLALPVTGSLSNPSFGTGDVVRQAMQKALQNAAMTYVKNALQPLGTLMLVGNLAAQAARPRFEPVAMAPGRDDLDDTGRAYLDKLAGVLTERPGLSLTLCGVATAPDREAIAAARAAAAAAESDAAPAPEGGDGEASASAATAGGGDPGENGAGTEAGAESSPPVVSDAALLELAGLRTSRVVGYLSDAGGIDRERLFLCRERIDEAADAQPRVEITL